MVAPDWVARGAGRFYFYNEESIEYALEKFLCQSRRDVSHSTSLQIGYKTDDKLVARARAFWPISCIQIPVLRAGELESFLGRRKDQIERPSSDDDEQDQLFLHNQIDFEEWRRSMGHR